MRRATFSVLFYANRSKVKDGIVPVMGRITINGTQSQFSCKRSIPLSLWDAKGNCAKGRTREALDLNRDLDNIKAQIIKHYQHLSDREAFVTAEMVRNAYQGFGSEYETLLRAFDKDCESLKRRVGKDRALGTYKLQVRSRNYVADFLQMNYRRSDISMQVIDFVASLVEELTPDFIKEFAVFLANDRHLAKSTIWLTCMHLKGVVGRAHDNGKIQRNVFAQFRISPKCKERTFLTEEELKAVMAHEFEDASLAFVRDLFVFMNFTALSFVDLKEIDLWSLARARTDYGHLSLPAKRGCGVSQGAKRTPPEHRSNDILCIAKRPSAERGQRYNSDKDLRLIPPRPYSLAQQVSVLRLFLMTISG